jgi:serine/threonine-protein kinase HipA
VRRARVYENGRLAGFLEEVADGFRFTYDPVYATDPFARAISITLPKRIRPYESRHLFAFFHGLLTEGALKDLQCRKLKVDEEDYFGRLVRTACGDTIGSVTVKPDEEA